MQNQETVTIGDSPDSPDDGPQVQLPAPAPGPDRLLISAEIKGKVAQAMGLLTPAERVAFTMRHMEGQSIEEISQVLKVRASAAKNCVFRAVQKLRHQLEPLAGRSARQASREWGGSAAK